MRAILCVPPRGGDDCHTLLEPHDHLADCQSTGAPAEKSSVCALRPPAETGLAPQDRRLQASASKGALTFWTRARRLFWSWWPWAIASLWAISDARWGWAIGCGAMALVSHLLTPAADPPRFGLDHEFAVDSPEFVKTMAGATGHPFLPGNRLELLNNGDAFYPRMLEAIKSAQCSVTVEAYIYWAGAIGKEFAIALAEQAQAGKSRQAAAGRRRLFEHRPGDSGSSRNGRLPNRLVQPDPLVHAGTIQQSHSPQVADHRRSDRLHWWRWHCRPLAWQRART